MAQSYLANRGWSESQALTRSAPSVASDGIGLDATTGYTVMVKGDGGTLSGAGTLQAYLWEDDVNAWSRCPDLDLTIPGGASGLTTFAFGAFTSTAPRGRLFYACTGVTVSAGTTATVFVFPFFDRRAA